MQNLITHSSAGGWPILTLARCEREHVKQEDTLTILNENIKVYPNPASDQLFVEIEGYEEESWEMVLYNIVGHQMLTSRIKAGQQKKTIDISNLPMGVYFYHAENTSKQKTNGRFVIIR